MFSLKQSASILFTSAALTCIAPASAQAPQTTQTTESQPTTTAQTPATDAKIILGVPITEMDKVIAGWSVQRDLMRKTVVNERNEKIGTITDIVVSPNPDTKTPAASFAIIGVGGFLGMRKHDVVIPMEQISIQDNRLVLSGATKETLKALPEFEYRRR